MLKGLDRWPTKAAALKHIRESIVCGASKGYAENYLRDAIPLESYYQKKIIEALKKKYPHADIWKEAQGPYSKQGRPDIAAVIDGKFYAFEVKRPYFGAVSAMQQLVIGNIIQAGGYAGVVVFPEDAFRIIEGSRQ